MATKIIHMQNKAGDVQRLVGPHAERVATNWEARGYKRFAPVAPYTAEDAEKAARATTRTTRTTERKADGGDAKPAETKESS